MRARAALILVACGLVLWMPSAVAQSESEVTVDSATIPRRAGNAPHIIPAPNSGAEPRQEGDRGSTTQILTLVGIVSAISFVALMIVRDSRRAKRARLTD